MKSSKVKLFESLSEDFVKNFEAAEPSKYGSGVKSYGMGSGRNTCKASLDSQIKQLRRLLLDIRDEIK